MATEIVTAAELSAWLQEPVTQTTADLLIAAATSIVQEVTGQALIQITGDVAVLEGSPDQYIELPQRPVTHVSSVIFQDGQLGPVTLDTTQYQPVGNRLWRGFGWQYATVLIPPARIPYWRYLTYPPPSTITVTYDHGWAPGAWQLEPARTAVLALCAQAYNNPAGSRSVTVDDYTETYSDLFAGMQMPESTKQLLRRRYGKRAGSTVPR